MSYPFSRAPTGGGGGTGPRGPRGMDGLSAYQIWMMQGNIGTEQDFLDSLRGANGMDGANGRDGMNGMDGMNGQSAYQIWVGLGNTGTMQDFINSLRGPAGSTNIVTNEVQPTNNIMLREGASSGTYSTPVTLMSFTIPSAGKAIVTVSLSGGVNNVASTGNERIYVRQEIVRSRGGVITVLNSIVTYVRNASGQEFTGIYEDSATTIDDVSANDIISVRLSAAGQTPSTTTQWIAFNSADQKMCIYNVVGA